MNAITERGTPPMTVSINPLDDDTLVKLMREHLPEKIVDELTYEKSPPMFPQATYDVPAFGLKQFAEAVARAALAHDEQAEPVGTDRLNQAYALGFAASGEGYNAEYPFDADFEGDEKWVEGRDFALASLLAAPVPEQASEHDGFMLVPVEPTLAMRITYDEKCNELGLDRFANLNLIWPALLAASPRSAS